MIEGLGLAPFPCDLQNTPCHVPPHPQAMALRDLGWLLGGTEGVMLIGHGERWYDEEMVRHEMDEPARHVMQDLIGEAGGSGAGTGGYARTTGFRCLLVTGVPI